MSDSRSRLEDIEPLGKSVEEVERDSQNRVNPPSLDGGDAGGAIAAVPPINSTGTWPGSTGLGASTPEVPTGPVVLPKGDGEQQR